jgi:anti-sigma regulatory factor (Ser/Thr protein kinase)
MVAMARIAIRDQLRAAGVVEEAWLALVTLAISEACANAVTQARREPPEIGTFTVEMARVAGEVAVRVLHNGRGMEPTIDSPSAGAGLSMITSVASRVTIQAPEDGTGVDVRMWFPVEAPATGSPAPL